MTVVRGSLFLLLAVLSSTCFAGSADLTALINERLSHMRDVALYKWLHDLPISDSQRERVVIDAGIRAGLVNGITAVSSERFYRSQIAAAKEIQACWFARWQSQPSPRTSTDLHTKIRPELIRLGNRIADQLSESPPDPTNFLSQVQVDCLTDEAKQAILDALSGIEQYPSRLEQIKTSGLLRVGTTGDYAPFSFSKDGNTFTGIDIDLARDLARKLGSQVIFVRTSWPSLMQDFQDGKFDIGMSGISITPARQRLAMFTNPYHVGGKTPIARCSEINRYDSISAIDRPGVRLIVNPGGTNEKFLDATIHQATKVLHEDNREVFQQIVDGAVDLMITDKIEVALQSSLHESLCGLPDETTFTYQEKGYLVPKEPALLETVNRWLEETRRSGRLQRTFSRHLAFH